MSLFSAGDWAAIALTLRLATVTTLILLVLGTPLAWWLARTASPLRALVETVTALPLVLPPTVLGFYLLVLLGPSGPVGGWWEGLGGDRLVFSFPGSSSARSSSPSPSRSSRSIPPSAPSARAPLEAAATIGATPRDRFFTVALPMARQGVVTSAALSFAHTVGEFGVVLMVGGNIPGRTQVVSIAIFDHVEALDYGSAHLLSFGMLVFSFAVLAVAYGSARTGGGRTP